jgi:hypothetical protein
MRLVALAVSVSILVGTTSSVAEVALRQHTVDEPWAPE